MRGFATKKERIKKARKIESILKDFWGREIMGFKILEVGCGSGIISSYFSKRNRVYAVDLAEMYTKKRQFKFTKVNSEKLPFKNKQFDIVISNHVIEHVKYQNLHLSEVKRVLKKNGICYLATPNKFFPLEVHYKMLFIHYLPKRLFYWILKRLDKFKEEIFLLNYFKLKKLIGLFFSEKKEYTHLIIKYPNKFGFNIPIINKLPLSIIEKINFLSQTNVFVLTK